VLRTEGASVLVRKLLRRLKSTPLSVAAVPELLDPRQPVGPFGLPRSEEPRVSIIIPIFNQLPFTLRCLASLGQQRSALPCEVVVLDDASTDETVAELLGVEGLQLVQSSGNQGFIRSCNRGASQARGEYLVFLNNDTQVQPGWLDALIGTFEQRPDAGLVGSRLIYPDGRQQEAGAILSADGSAWNYGHLDDPYKPQYS
jgi:GT2 family glycosyltransferase